jgi:hypothetical protein
MYKYILESGNVNWMGIFVLLTFFLVFSISLFVVIFKKKDWVDYMSNLPLDEEKEIK